MMRYDYVLTYSDYKDAQLLYRKHRWKAALSYYCWIWVLPIAGFIVGFPLIAHLFNFYPDWLISLAPFSVLGLWFAFFIPIARFYNVRKCWKRLLPDSVKKSIKTELPVEIEFTNEQVISTLPGRSEGRFFWSAILDFAENDRLALLFVKKKLFLFVPRRALPDEAWTQLRSYVANKGVTP